jgi:hypothetical protein
MRSIRKSAMTPILTGHVKHFARVPHLYDPELVIAGGPVALPASETLDSFPSLASASAIGSAGHISSLRRNLG